MSKKTMLIAFATVSAMLFALPTFASGQEIEVDPGAKTQFKVSGGASSITAAGEPTITCETMSGEGELINQTTSTVLLDLQECHILQGGVTVPCHSSNAPLGNTIAFGEIIHWITVNSKPGALFTGFPKIFCGFLGIQIGGNGLIGTITAPACSVESKTMTIKFVVNAGKQEHMLYTTVNYDLTYTTEGGAAVTAAFQGEPKFTFGVNIKPTCK
jgi:hypothetical protein